MIRPVQIAAMALAVTFMLFGETFAQRGRRISWRRRLP